MLNEDYKDMLQAFVEEKAKFLLVGAYALAAHGYLRATMDIDIWVMPSRAFKVTGCSGKSEEFFCWSGVG